MPSKSKKSAKSDIEAQSTARNVSAEKSTVNKTFENKNSSGLTAGTSVFHWEDLCYDIQIKGKDRRLLDNVDGWVKPGLSTALMVGSLEYYMRNALLIIAREYRELARLHCWMSLLHASPWESSAATPTSMECQQTLLSNTESATCNSRIFI